MGQLALGFRSLLVKLAVFFLLASLLAWTLGGTLWPRAEIVDLAPVSYGQKAWFLRLEVGGKHRGRALWRLMTLGPDGEPQPADERQWDDVAGPVLTRDGLFIGLAQSDPTAVRWRIEQVAGPDAPRVYDMPDRLAVEQQLARLLHGLPVQSREEIERQRPWLLNPTPPISDE